MKNKYLGIGKIGRQMSKRELNTMMVNKMTKAGLEPEYIYAFKKTERLVTEENKKFLTDAEIQEWDDAVNHFRRLHGR